MSLPLAGLIVIVIALVAGAVALAAFVWAVRTRQFSLQQLNKGAYQVFDGDEPAGQPTDLLFYPEEHSTAARHGTKETQQR